MNYSDRNTEAVFKASFWEKTWRELGSSFLADHQRRYPQRWHRFYDSQGPALREISGLDQEQGRMIIDPLWQQGGLFPGCSVIDLGCGTGWLALPLALKEARVLAVDSSSDMLESLQGEARMMNLSTLTTQHTCWTEIETDKPFDLALAACFPPALCPDGISRMEGLGKKCALLLPAGEQGLPWVKNLWKDLCDRYPFSGPRQLQTSFNYLTATGRKPNLLHITAPFSVDLPLEQMLDFYAGYFSLFDRSGPKVRTVIQRELKPFIHEGRVQTRGESCFGLIWWGR
jgi:SAM-dependent methyltransferase